MRRQKTNTTPSGERYSAPHTGRATTVVGNIFYRLNSETKKREQEKEKKTSPKQEKKHQKNPPPLNTSSHKMIDEGEMELSGN